VAHVHDVVAREVYGAAIEDVLEDHKLDEDEERFLQRLREELGVSEADASRMYEQEARKAQQRLLSSSPNTGGFLAARDGVFELKGTSTTGLQEAVQTVVDESCHALPHLSWAELSEVRVRIESGHIAEWQIKLKAGLKTPAVGSSPDPSSATSSDPTAGTAADPPHEG
jgi:flavin-binding protein dodecin